LQANIENKYRFFSGDLFRLACVIAYRVRGLYGEKDHEIKGECIKMSEQNRNTLKSTIYNLSDGDAALYAALASMTDEQLEQILTDICSKP